jgi:hypothetical protein
VLFRRFSMSVTDEKEIGTIHGLREGDDLGRMSPREKRYVPHYKQGPQGNMVADYKADFDAMYGEVPDVEILGTPGIPDLRDNRWPAVVGESLLVERETTRAADKARTNGA